MVDDDEEDQIQEFKGLPHGGSSMLKSVASPQKEFDDGQISHSPPQRNEPNIFSLTNRYKNTK